MKSDEEFKDQLTRAGERKENKMNRTTYLTTSTAALFTAAAMFIKARCPLPWTGWRTVSRQTGAAMQLAQRFWRNPAKLFVCLATLATLVGKVELARGSDYMLAAVVTPPFRGDCTGPVIRYRFTGTCAVDPLPSIPGCPETLLNDPAAAAFSSFGELFVSNRHGNVGRGQGSITRFVFDVKGNYLANGLITGNGLEAVHGLAFSPSGELFAANLFRNTISRFLFDEDGNAIPNGTIDSPPGSFAVGVAFSPDGELFVTTYTELSRYIFDESGRAILKGTIPVPGSGQFHFLSFSPGGELFLARLDDNLIFRYVFDEDGTAIPNGTITVTAPIGIAFSLEGELFVSSHLDGRRISRFLFDKNGNPVPNGTIDPGYNSLGGLAINPL